MDITKKNIKLKEENHCTGCTEKSWDLPEGRTHQMGTVEHPVEPKETLEWELSDKELEMSEDLGQIITEFVSHKNFNAHQERLINYFSKKEKDFKAEIIKKLEEWLANELAEMKIFTKHKECYCWELDRGICGACNDAIVTQSLEEAIQKVKEILETL